MVWDEFFEEKKVEVSVGGERHDRCCEGWSRGKGYTVFIVFTAAPTGDLPPETEGIETVSDKQ